MQFFGKKWLNYGFSHLPLVLALTPQTNPGSATTTVNLDKNHHWAVHVNVKRLTDCIDFEDFLNLFNISTLVNDRSIAPT